MAITDSAVVLDLLLAKKAPEFCAHLASYMTDLCPAFSVAIACGSGLSELVGRVNAPVLSACVDGSEILFGPLFIPGRSACPACLQHWIDLRLYDRPDDAVETGEEGALQVAERLRGWFERFSRDGRVDELEDAAVSLDLKAGTVARHPVFRRADCVACGPSRDAGAPSLAVHCSAWTGIVQRVEVTDVESAGAFRASGSWTPPAPAAGVRRRLARQHSYGRGRTMQDAARSCIGEALERYSLIYRGDEPFRRARFEEIDAIHPADITMYSDAQYRTRDEWNATAAEMFYVPEPFAADVPVDWLEARPLSNERSSKWVPAATCLMWYEFSPGEPEFARADTIGCAGGMTFEDALCGALLEAIERDAMALWWDNMVKRPAMIAASFDSPELDFVVDGLRAIGRDLFLLDCTTDIGVPTYVAVAPRSDGSEPLVAGAADMSPRVAAYRAASEVGQVWYEARRTSSISSLIGPWLLRENVADHGYLSPAEWKDAPAIPSGVERTSAAIVERLEAAGLEAYAIDHTRTDVCTRTVRAVVPGLRHIWNRRAPGRLYDVPVKIGWRTRPALEAELNPIRCMI